MTNNIFFYSLVLFAAYISCSARNIGPVDPSEFNCRTAQPPAVNCQTDPNCLYPNPRDCSRYYQCTDDYRAYDMPCAPINLVFNNNTKRCDWPENYNCTVTPTPPNAPPAQTTEEPTTEQTTEIVECSTDPPTEAVPPVITEQTPEQTTEEPTEEPSTEGGEEASTGAPTTEVTETVTDVPPTEQNPPFVDCSSPQAYSELEANCNTPRRCMFPNPDTCQGFIQCQRGSDVPPYSPITNRMPCAYGHNGQLYWNDNTYTCEERDNSTCTQLSAKISILFALK